MADFRNPNDPLSRGTTPYDPNVRGTSALWGWVAGAVFLAVVLAIAFGMGRSPNQTTNRMANNSLPPITQTSPTAPGPANPTFSPPLNPTHPTPPASKP